VALSDKLNLSVIHKENNEMSVSWYLRHSNADTIVCNNMAQKSPMERVFHVLSPKKKAMGLLKHELIEDQPSSETRKHIHYTSLYSIIDNSN